MRDMVSCLCHRERLGRISVRSKTTGWYISVLNRPWALHPLAVKLYASLQLRRSTKGDDSMRRPSRH